MDEGAIRLGERDATKIGDGICAGIEGMTSEDGRIAGGFAISWVVRSGSKTGAGFGRSSAYRNGHIFEFILWPTA